MDWTGKERKKYSTGWTGRMTYFIQHPDGSVQVKTLDEMRVVEAMQARRGNVHHPHVLRLLGFNIPDHLTFRVESKLDYRTHEYTIIVHTIEEHAMAVGFRCTELIWILFQNTEVDEEGLPKDEQIMREFIQFLGEHNGYYIYPFWPLGQPPKNIYSIGLERRVGEIALEWLKKRGITQYVAGPTQEHPKRQGIALLNQVDLGIADYVY